MSNIKRYLFENRKFDQDYDPDADNDYNYADDEEEDQEEDAEEESPEAPPAPTFNEEELLEAQQKAYDEGKEAGLKEAMDKFEQQLAASATQIEQSLKMLFDEHVASQDAHLAQAVKVSASTAKILIPAYVQNHKADEIVHVVSQCLEPLRSEPRLIVKVHESLREEINTRLTKIADDFGFDGRIVVMDHDDILPGDCRVEWSDGGAERNSEELWRQIDEIIERNLTEGRKEGDNPQDQGSEPSEPDN